MIAKFRQIVKRIVSRQEKTRPRPQSRRRRQKMESSRSVLVHYGQGDLMVVVL